MRLPAAGCVCRRAVAFSNYDRRVAPTLDHVQVMMPEGGEDEARAFYAGLLGLTEVEKPGPMRAHGGVWFAEGIHVSVEEGFTPPRRARSNGWLDRRTRMPAPPWPWRTTAPRRRCSSAPRARLDAPQPGW